jgi:hypothetical protein
MPLVDAYNRGHGPALPCTGTPEQGCAAAPRAVINTAETSLLIVLHITEITMLQSGRFSELSYARARRSTTVHKVQHQQKQGSNLGQQKRNVVED